MISRRILLPLLSIFIGLCIAALLLELLLRLTPVRAGMLTANVNEHSPYKHFMPNTDFTFSKGFTFELVNRGRINNYGFTSNIDYRTDATTPLLAIVGDSYVEAAMVPYRQTVQGLLAECLGQTARVYSMGTSGSPLSQYLAYARYFRDEFKPEVLVVVVVGNDFDESFAAHKPGNKAGFHFFRGRDDGTLALERHDFHPTPFQQLRHSALVRYLWSNIHGVNLRNLFGETPEATEFAGQTASDFSPERLRISHLAVDQFLHRLPKESALPPQRLVLVLDAVRPQIYDTEHKEAAQRSYFGLMRRYLMEKAGAQGFEIIDMAPRFIERHGRDGSRFEYPSDGHWNPAGHAEAARALFESNAINALLAEKPGLCSALNGDNP